MDVRPTLPGGSTLSHEGNRILIGNLSTDAQAQQIRDFFAGTSGRVKCISIPTDPRTGKGRGYAFVEMNNRLEAQEAVADLNGQNIDGRKISISLVETKRVKKWYQ